MRKLFVSALLFVLFFESCNNGDQKMLSHENVPFDSSMKYSIARRWDSIKKNEADSSGKKIDRYYIKNRLILEVDYEKEGMLGVEKEFYPNGRLKRKSNFALDKYYGDTYVYFDNGSLFCYLCYDFSEKIFRRKYYKKDGVISGDDGEILGQARVKATDSVFRVDGDKVIYFVIANPPNEKTIYEVILKQAGKKEGTIKCNKYDNTIVFDNKELMVGSYQLVLSAKSIDTLLRRNYYDTLITGFSVR